MVRERPRRAPGIVLMLTCLASYAFFWQSRDWNSASRLMLTYALVDRRSLSIDGFERQCADVEYGADGPLVRGGDIAYREGHFYSDKAPGLSFFGAIVYAILPQRDGIKPHPIDRDAVPYWAADYWVTLGTSGLATALAAYIVYRFVLLLGAPCWAAVTAGLAYGLGSPAFVYGTLFYGHNLTGLFLVTALYTLARTLIARSSPLSNALLCGLLVGLVPVVEYPAALASAALAVAALFVFRRLSAVLVFAYGAVMGASLLLAYNYKAFGSPFTLSYEYEASRMFQEVHSPDKPLGIRLDEPPDWKRLPELFWKQRRGLLWYAPFFALATVGAVVLLFSRFWGILVTALVAVGAFIWVNLVYPAWDGGWCTGPRLLTATYPILAVLAGGTFRLLRSRWLVLPAMVLVLVGVGVNLGCVAVGGRFPPVFDRPLEQVVLPRWRGEQPTEGGEGSVLGMLAGGAQFERNLGHMLIGRLAEQLSEAGAGGEGAGRQEGEADGGHVSFPAWLSEDRVKEILVDASGSWSRYRAIEFVPLLLLWAILLPVAFRFCPHRRRA